MLLRLCWDAPRTIRQSIGVNVTLTTNFASNSSRRGRINFQRAPARVRYASIERGSLAESDTGTVFDLLDIRIRLIDPRPPNRGVNCSKRAFRQGWFIGLTCWLPKPATSTTVGAWSSDLPDYLIPASTNVAGVWRLRGKSQQFLPNFPRHTAGVK